MNYTVESFIHSLASPAPTPGGGGASAVIGAVGAALGNMVAQLTSGKAKYAQFQPDIDRILARTRQLADSLLALADADETAFAPLADAYRIPKDAPGREAVMESALAEAASVPAEIVRTVALIVPMLSELTEKGSRLAQSDVGVAASACRCACESAAMNVYINTKLMKSREAAEQLNGEISVLCGGVAAECGRICDIVMKGLI